jgi:hypothetical protein
MNQKFCTSQTPTLANKVEVITQSNILNGEVQQAIRTWCDFIQ